MIWFVVKFIMFSVAVVFALTVYLRGAKFVEQDIPFLQSIIEKFNTGEMSTLMHNLSSLLYNTVLSGILGFKSQPWSHFTDSFTDKQESKPKTRKRNKHKKQKDQGKQFEQDAIDMLSNYGIEVDESYLEYINENFGFQDNKENVGKFMESVNGALSGIGIDVNQMADFMDRFN